MRNRGSDFYSRNSQETMPFAGCYNVQRAVILATSSPGRLMVPAALIRHRPRGAGRYSNSRG